MSRGDVGLVLGLAGFLLGAFAIYESHSMKSDVESLKNERLHDEDLVNNLGARVEALDRVQKDMTERLNKVDASPRSQAERLRVIEERLQLLESRVPPEPDGRAATSPVVKASEPAAPHKWTKEEIHALEEKLASGNATDEDRAQLAAVIASLESEVKDTPRDVQAHLQLADLYIQKLMTVPEGMERGTWSMKAVAEWKKVLDIDPDNWDAHTSLGVNYSFWPEQFNKRPEAIKELEAARKIQERSTPDPKHADTYLQLRLLYLKEGKADQAKEVLEEGLRRFPDDEELKTARDGAK